MKETAKVTVFRFNPKTDKAPRYETYEVPVGKGMSILNAIQYVSENYDPGIGYYLSCRYGLCKGCAVKVDGRNRLACTEPFKKDVTLEPISFDRVVKDLFTIKTDKGDEN